jgi:hypothetical protein
MNVPIKKISEEKQAKKYYGVKNKGNQQGIWDTNLSVFDNFLSISDKYDCVAFQQIDEDIAAFRFPAYYYDESTIQPKIESKG